MFQASIEITGLEAGLATCLAAATEEATLEAKQILTRNVEQQFLTEGMFSGTPWIPRRARERELPRRPLLFHTGRLRGSFLDEQSPDHIEQEQDDGSLLWGSAVPYAAAHQWGTVHLPARPILTEAVLGQ